MLDYKTLNSDCDVCPLWQTEDCRNCENSDVQQAVFEMFENEIEEANACII